LKTHCGKSGDPIREDVNLLGCAGRYKAILLWRLLRRFIMLVMGMALVSVMM
jgi:hypothetical protein